MLMARTRIGRIRRRVALRAFLCGAACGVAVAMTVLEGIGPAAAGALMASSVGGLAVMILGVRSGNLRRRAEDLADMLGSVQAGLIVLDDGRICTSVTPRARQLLEMPADWDPTGLTVTEILTELADRGDFGPRVPPRHPIDPEHFRSPAFEEIYVETPRGRIVSFAVAELARGGWVLTCTDITQHKEQTRMVLRAQRELEESEARARELARAAEAANDAKSAYLTAISHEIRTPMNGILGMSEILAESALGEEQQSHVATIRQSCESLLLIINDLLDLSKIEAGRMTLAPAPFGLRATIDDVLRLTCPRARQRGLAVLLDYGSDLPERFVGDQQRLRQVLINLVGNAVKFTLEGGVVVRVRGAGAGGPGRMALEIAVEDTGIGIAAVDLERIFGEFARVEGGRTRRFEGTGLGLAISRRLVELMRGEIGVESEYGVGTTFTVRLTLPVAEGVAGDAAGDVAGAAVAATVEPRVAAHPAGLPAGRRLAVLLAEDNRTNQIVVAGLLASEPIELTVAGDGAEAVRLFRALAPDIVLMDLCMPEMDGLAATAAIRRIEAEAGMGRTPVIALTAYAGNEDREHCLAQGMDDYLRKPLDKAALVRAIRRHAAARAAAAAPLADAG